MPPIITFSNEFQTASAPSHSDFVAHHEFIKAVDYQCAFAATRLGKTLKAYDFTKIPAYTQPLCVEVTQENFWRHIVQEQIRKQLLTAFQNMSGADYPKQIKVTKYKKGEDRSKAFMEFMGSEVELLVNFPGAYLISNHAKIIGSNGFLALKEICDEIGAIMPNIYVYTRDIDDPIKRESSVGITFSPSADSNATAITTQPDLQSTISLHGCGSLALN